MSYFPDANKYASHNTNRKRPYSLLIASSNPILEEKATKVRFATLTASTLQKAYGLNEAEAWQVIRSAGPGMAISAAKFGSQLYRLNRKKPERIVTFLMLVSKLVSKFTSHQNFRFSDWKTWEKVMGDNKIDTPIFISPREFFRTLKGARKFLILKLTKTQHLR